LEAVHSEQCIGYILKYYSKNSDLHAISTVLYEGDQISPYQRLQRDAAPRISSAVECFAAIAGERRHHLNQTVRLLTVHLEAKKVILMCEKDLHRADERLN
jgi:hypothetical protein